MIAYPTLYALCLTNLAQEKGPFVIRDYDGECVRSTNECGKATQRAIETLMSHQADLRQLNKLSREILEELNIPIPQTVESGQAASTATVSSEADASNKFKQLEALPEDDPVRLLMEDYRRVCKKNEELVNMVMGLQQMNTDLSFFAQNLLNKYAAVAPRDKVAVPASLAGAIQAPGASTSSTTTSSANEGGKLQTFFIPSVFNEFLAPPTDLAHDCEVCQEIVKLMTVYQSMFSSKSQTDEEVKGITAVGKVKVDDTAGAGGDRAQSSKPASAAATVSETGVSEVAISGVDGLSSAEFKDLSDTLRNILARDSLISQIARDQEGWKAASDRHLDALSAALTEAALKSKPVQVAQSHAIGTQCSGAAKVLVWTIAAALVAYMIGGRHVGPSGDHYYT